MQTRRFNTKQVGSEFKQRKILQFGKIKEESTKALNCLDFFSRKEVVPLSIFPPVMKSCQGASVGSPGTVETEGS
jgi:hypothetical protein